MISYKLFQDLQTVKGAWKAVQKRLRRVLGSTIGFQ